MTLIGIDPGMNTGAAEYRDGALVALAAIRPHRIGAMLEAVKPALVVFEDSRLQSHVWTRAKPMPPWRRLAATSAWWMRGAI